MAHQLIQQPNGLIAVWSTIVDDFIILDAHLAEVAEFFAARAADRARSEMNSAGVAVCSGRAREFYGQGTMTWKQALERRRCVHQPEYEDLLDRENDPRSTIG